MTDHRIITCDLLQEVQMCPVIAIIHNTHFYGNRRIPEGINGGLSQLMHSEGRG